MILSTGPTSDFNQVTLKWAGVNLDGTPCVGSLSLTYNSTVPLLDDDDILPVSIYPVELTKTLTTTTIQIRDSAGNLVTRSVGYCEWDVPASDDPDIQGFGGTYTIVERLTNGRGQTRNFVASKDTLNGVIWVNKITSVTAVSGQAISAVSVAEFNQLKSQVAALLAGGGGSSGGTGTGLVDGSVTNAKVSDSAGISADKIANGVNNKVYTALEKTKLTNIANNATANSTDATLLSRSNHSGQQSASTISDFQEATEDVIGAAALRSGGSYNDALGTITWPASTDYTWNRIGTNAQRLALDVTALRPGTIFSATDAAASPKPYMLDGTGNWIVFGAANKHADQHAASSTIDTITSASINAAPNTNIPITMLDAATQAKINGISSGTPADTTAPSVPTNVVASALTSSGFTLNWTASTDDVGVTGYDVQIGGVSYATPTATTLAVTGRAASTAYSIRVRARDAAGNYSALSTAITVTTPAAADTTAPSVPTNVVASSVTATGFTLNWTASTDDVAVTGYDVQIGGVSYATPTATTLAVTGRSASTAYSVRVRARDAAGNYSALSTAITVTTPAASGADTTAPSVPSGLVASNLTSNSFTISWTASTDDVAVTAYDLTVDGTTYATPTGTTVNIITRSPSTSYVIKVRARDAAGNYSVPSSPLTVTTPASGSSDTTAPSVPTNVVASAFTSSGFILNWTASTDNVGVANYDVQIGGVSYASPSSTTQSVSGLTAGTAYSVRVRAVDAAGNYSALSTAISVTTGPTGQESQGVVPLGANDTYMSGPIDCNSKNSVDVSVVADQAFTARLDTSANGSDFTTGTTVYTAALSSGSYRVTQTVSTPSAWTRLVIICGTTGMSRLTATTYAHV